MTWIKQRLAERRAWEPEWLRRLFLVSFAIAVAIPAYAATRPLAPSWYWILAVVAGLWFANVMGVQAVYERRWKRRSNLR